MAGTSNKPLQNISLAAIGPDALTRFSLSPPPDTLVESIRELGVTHPVLLAPDGEQYTLVCGHRRVECARQLEMKDIPAFVMDVAPAPAERIRLNLLENRAHRSYSDMEKSRIVLALKEAGMPESETIKNGLPLLDLERSKKLYTDLCACAVFSENAVSLFHTLNLPLRILAPLFRWDDAGRDAVVSLLNTLRPGVNKCRELLELIDETAVKENTTPYEILNRTEIQTPLNDADLPANEKYETLHQQLRLWRFPVLTDLQRQVYRAIDQLKLDDKTRLRTPPNFESGQFKIELNFTSREELVKQVEQLFRVTDAEALDELIRIFNTQGKGS